MLLSKVLNGKFTPRPNLTIMGLFIYNCLYISHKKCITPFYNPLTRLKPFFPKILSLETTIVGEAQEQIKDGFYMYESSSLIGFQIDKSMVIFISSYVFI